MKLPIIEVIESRGYTWRRKDGTIGLGRQPTKTYEEARELMDLINAEYIETCRILTKSKETGRD